MCAILLGCAACGGAESQSPTEPNPPAAPGAPPGGSTPLDIPGIPAPEFGLSDTAGPATHFVDNSHPEATDEGNPAGTPERPRLTVPATLAAGSVVEVSGGPYVVSTPDGRDTWFLSGEAGRPVFVRGVGDPVFTSPEGRLLRLQAAGSYFVVEGLVLDRLAFGFVGHHGALRRSVVRGFSPGHNDAAVAGSGQHFVIAESHIHDNGDPNSGEEIDVHGIKFAEGTEAVWVLGNHVHHSGGDAIQLGDDRSGEPWVRFVFIGANRFHDDRENCVDVKQARDIVVSRNECYGYRPVSSSDGTAIVVHNAPERVWVVFNHVHDASQGIRNNDNDGGGTVYVVGNLVHGVHHPSPASRNPDDPYSLGTGIISWDSGEMHIVDNTIWDVDAGISYASGDAGARIRMSGNIVGGLSGSSPHVSVGGRAADTSSLAYSLLQPGARVRWGADDWLFDVNGLQSQGQCQGCLEAEPGFVAAGADDYRLGAGSPAVDSGVRDAAYDLFRDLYGLDLAVDIEGTPRPQGGGWDIGAFERPTASAAGPGGER